MEVGGAGQEEAVEAGEEVEAGEVEEEVEVEVL